MGCVFQDPLLASRFVNTCMQSGENVACGRIMGRGRRGSTSRCMSLLASLGGQGARRGVRKQGFVSSGSFVWRGGEGMRGADSSSCAGALCVEGPRRMQDWRSGPPTFFLAGTCGWLVLDERSAPAGGSVVFGNIASSGDGSGGAGGRTSWWASISRVSLLRWS